MKYIIEIMQAEKSMQTKIEKFIQIDSDEFVIKTFFLNICIRFLI